MKLTYARILSFGISIFLSILFFLYLKIDVLTPELIKYAILFGGISGLLLGVIVYTLVKFKILSDTFNRSSLSKSDLDQLYADSFKYKLPKNITPADFHNLIETMILEAKVDANPADIADYCTAMICYRFKVLYNGKDPFAGYPEITKLVETNEFLIKVIAFQRL